MCELGSELIARGTNNIVQSSAPPRIFCCLGSNGIAVDLIARAAKLVEALIVTSIFVLGNAGLL